MEHLMQQAAQHATCAVCDASSREKELKRCAACQAVWYCDAEHQKQHWKTHKAICKLIPDAHRNVRSATPPSPPFAVVSSEWRRFGTQ
jgi:hypothetical protein